MYFFHYSSCFLSVDLKRDDFFGGDWCIQHYVEAFGKESDTFTFLYALQI